MAAPRRGIGLPTFGALAGPESVAMIARTAENLGFDGVSAADRLLLPADPGPVGRPCQLPSPVWDSIEMLTWSAAHTTRVRLAATVIHSLFQPPVVLARRLATLDRLSGGRLLVGVGQGWTPHEHQAAGVGMDSRAARFAEHLDLMRKCWRPGPVVHEGGFYQLRSSWVEPKPLQMPLPVFVAAVTPDGIAQAAALADGFMYPVTQWGAAREAVRHYRESGGAGSIALRLNPIRDKGDNALKRFEETLPGDLQRAIDLGADDVHWEFNQSAMTLAEQCRAMALIADMA